MEEIRVRVKDGYLVTVRNDDPDYDGVTCYLEMDNGDVVTIVSVECKAEKNFDELDVYNYEDKTSEDWTRKYVIKI